MSAATIIKQAADDGVAITASSTGHLRLSGDQTAVARWVPVIRDHKPDILAALLTDPAVEAIKAWLEYVGETHQPTIDEVLTLCATDPAALTYYLKRSTEIRTGDDETDALRPA